MRDQDVGGGRAGVYTQAHLTPELRASPRVILLFPAAEEALGRPVGIAQHLDVSTRELAWSLAGRATGLAGTTLGVQTGRGAARPAVL